LWCRALDEQLASLHAHIATLRRERDAILAGSGRSDADVETLKLELEELDTMRAELVATLESVQVRRNLSCRGSCTHVRTCSRVRTR
jgi:predicted RNase H-like nuclease (RuvC/YqgF family)